MYRRASADTIIELIEHTDAECGVYPHKADVFWFPQQDDGDDANTTCDGMYVLQSLPTQLPRALPFVENSAHELSDMIDIIRSKFRISQPDTVTQWLEFAKEAPKTNDVEKYIQDHPLHIPLAERLFSGNPVDPTPVVPISSIDADSSNMRRVRTTDCVQWACRGIQRPSNHPENNTRLMTLFDRDGNPVMVNAMPKKVN